MDTKMISSWKYPPQVTDESDRDWGPLSVAIGNVIYHSGILDLSRNIFQAATGSIELMAPVIRDFQERMIELEKEIARAKWQASIGGEPSADEGNPSSAVEYLEQKRQQMAKRQAEERRGRIKPWDKPGKRFR